MKSFLSAEPEDTKEAVLFVAAGFEQRSVAYLNNCASRGRYYHRVIVVNYLPANPRNRYEEAVRSAKAVGSQFDERIFDRFYPFESDGLNGESLTVLCEERRVVLDVSGMSKFLIVILVTRLIRAGLSPTIAYTEPSVYHPTETKWLDDTHSTKGGETDQVFLTTGLFDITTVPDLTRAAMSGEPEVLVSSPNFEPRFIRALINELAPSGLVLIEGCPPDPANRWRRRAVKEMNAFAFETADSVMSVSTASVEESRIALQEVFRQHKYTHRMIVVPAASKLSAVGMAIAISTEIECEVVYPTPLGFNEPYTVGVGNTRFVEVEGTGPVET